MLIFYPTNFAMGMRLRAPRFRHAYWSYWHEADIESIRLMIGYGMSAY